MIFKMIWCFVRCLVYWEIEWVILKVCMVIIGMYMSRIFLGFVVDFEIKKLEVNMRKVVEKIVIVFKKIIRINKWVFCLIYGRIYFFFFMFFFLVVFL